MNENEFKSLPIGKMFIKCTLPNILSMMFSSLYFIVDGIFIGRYVGEVGLAAVNISWPFLMITFAMADMIAVGSSVKISLTLGRDDKPYASKIFSSGVMLVLILSAFFGSLAIFIAEYMNVFIARDLLLADYTSRYLKTIGYFAVGFIPLYAMDNYLRICGKLKLCMYINIMASLLNIFLDWLFLARLGLGIESAAVATGISTSLGTIIALIIFASNKLTLKFTKPNLPFKDIKEIIYNGSSEFFGKISSAMVSILTNAFLLSLGGAIAVTAYSIVMYIDGVVRSIIFGIVDSLQPPITYNFGADKPKRVLGIYKLSLIVTGSISIIAMLAVIVTPEIWIGIFIDKNEQATINIAVTALLLFAPTYLTSWYNIVTGSILTSLDRPKESLIVMSLTSVVFPLISVVVLTSFFGLYGVFLTPAVTQTATFFACLYYFSIVKKKLL